jgi:hypothetical protein
MSGQLLITNGDNIAVCLYCTCLRLQSTGMWRHVVYSYECADWNSGLVIYDDRQVGGTNVCRHKAVHPYRVFSIIRSVIGVYSV